MPVEVKNQFPNGTEPSFMKVKAGESKSSSHMSEVSFALHCHPNDSRGMLQVLGPITEFEATLHDQNGDDTIKRPLTEEEIEGGLKFSGNQTVEIVSLIGPSRIEIKHVDPHLPAGVKDNQTTRRKRLLSQQKEVPDTLHH